MAVRNSLAALFMLCCCSSAWAGLAEEYEERFMQACLRDATVAAGQRQALCLCVRDTFTYGRETSFGLSDVLSLDSRAWEAPDRRLPRSSLGQEVRKIRQACLNK